MQEAAELLVPAATIATALDGRYISALKDERVAANKFYRDLGVKDSGPLKVLDIHTIDISDLFIKINGNLQYLDFE